MGFTKFERKKRTSLKVRKRVFGLSERPRLCVRKSGKNIYAQLIDDEKEITLISASSVEKEFKTKGNLKSGANISAAELVGKLIAERAISKNIKEVVFDRGGNIFAGRLEKLANSARDAGLIF